MDGWTDVEGDKKSGGLIVRFYRGTKRDVFTSNAQGFPVDNGVDMVEVRQAGEKDNNVFQVDESHRRRWREQWAAYLEGREQIGNGRPLDLLFPGNPEIVSSLKAQHIHTVEQLANIPDSSPNSAFVHTWKQTAIKFLAGVQNNAFPQLQQELDAEKAKSKIMEEQMAAMQRQLAAMATKQDDDVEEAPIRRGPGRPPKIREGESA